MKHLYALALLLALASCAAIKPLPHYSEAEKQAQRESISWWKPAPPPATYMVPAKDSAEAARYEAAPDSLPFVKVPPAPRPAPAYEVEEAKKGFLSRIFLPSKRKGAASAAATAASAPQLPRKCKGCTIVYGNAQVVGKKGQVLGDGASVKGDTKAKGGAVVSQDSSSTTALTGAGNQSATKGNNNATTQTKQDTNQEAPGVGATIASKLTGPLGWVVGLVALGGVSYGLYYVWFLIPRRKKRADTATDTTTV